jgi:hypothetical protein
MTQQMYRTMAMAMGGGGTGDPYWSDVFCLLYGDGTNGSTVATDEKGVTWNNNGGSTSYSLDTSIKKFGTASIYCDANTATANKYGDVADTTIGRLGGSDFCLETQFYADTLYTTNFSPVFMSKRAASNNEFSWYYFNGTLGFAASNDGTNFPFAETVSWTPSTGQWYALAVDRNGSNFRFFVDGTQVGTTKTISTTIYAGSARLKILGDGINAIKGQWHMEQIRGTKHSRYTGNYTPQTANFPNS